MNDSQFYVAICVPVFAVLMGFIGTALKINPINGRITSLEAAIDRGFTSLEARLPERLERR